MTTDVSERGLERPISGAVNSSALNPLSSSNVDLPNQPGRGREGAILADEGLSETVEVVEA